MLTKMWASIQNWVQAFSSKREEPIRVLPRRTTARFLIKSDPRPCNKCASPLPQALAEIPQSKEELETLYKLICEEESKLKATVEEESNEEFLQELTGINEAVAKITLHDHEISSEREPYKRMQDMAREVRRVNNCGTEEARLYAEYNRQVVVVLQSKYRGERMDYPEISFEEFKTIEKLWRANSREAEKIVPGCLHLKIKDLQLLDNRRWLNDEIISEYASLLKQQIDTLPNQQESFKILNSLQVTAFFDRRKYDEAKVFKFFGRQKIETSDTILLAVHKINHWIFVKLNRMALQIYDSIYRANVEEYLKFPTLDNIYHFAEKFYGATPKVTSIRDFPQQSNDYDCGMMMLCGMKDCLRGSVRWTFSQAEIPYRRVLAAKELLDHRLAGF